MSNIYEQFDELQEQLQHYALNRIEEYYYTRCCEVAGTEVT